MKYGLKAWLKAGLKPMPFGNRDGNPLYFLGNLVLTRG